jgi:aconitate decarboxylase
MGGQIHDDQVQDPALSEDTGATAQLCSWITNLKVQDVPTEVLERAKHLILDGIACGLIGARVPWSEEATSSIVEYEPPGYCTVIGSDQVRPLFISQSVSSRVY